MEDSASNCLSDKSGHYLEEGDERKDCERGQRFMWRPFSGTKWMQVGLGTAAVSPTATPSQIPESEGF
jgi:hypothetical protein